jgi:hypothetical protein
MKRRFALATLAALAVGVAVPAYAQQWVLLGSRSVATAVDHDTIPVTAGMGTFDRIQLRVVGNGLFIYDLDVLYGNGAREDISVRLHIPQGGQTRVIDLRGGARVIAAVTMTYERPADGDGETVVQVWGQR